ncbi:MAG: aromatic hydrocarbon degradation protein [Hyphomicrobiales bacterium]|jgi:long-chain fatty acid transport protein|nr:aromatic hydrocarbon degradation protein [Hyphomicrobiales bacterium]
MHNNLRHGLRATVAVSALLCTVAASQAGGFALREQSAEGQGMSFAGVGAGSAGLSSMFWNPAAITMTPGWNSEWDVAGILPYSSITPTAAVTPLVGSGNIGEKAVLPSGYSNYQINDRWWIGLVTGAPYGLVTKSNEIWAGQAYGVSSKVVSFNANAIVGWKVNDWLTIAAGPSVEYFSVRLRGSAAAFGPGGQNILQGNNTSIGGTAGIMLTPWAGTRIGLGYRSAITHNLQGGLTPGFPITFPVTTKVTLPETVTFGLSQDFATAWTANFGIEWTNWSRLKTSDVTNSITGVTFPFPAQQRYNWRDGWFFSTGLEYAYSPTWTFRGGLAYEISPVSDATRSVRLPDTDRIWASLGFSYRYSNKLSFDVGYSHIFGKNGNINNVPGSQNYIPPLVFVANTQAHVDIVSVGVKYRWDNPVGAVVAKY